LNELASHFRLFNFIKKLRVKEDQIESFIINSTSGAGDTGSSSCLPGERVVDLTNQLFNISTSQSIPLVQVPDHITQKLQHKEKLEQEIKEVEAILKSKNVSIETIEEHIHLSEQLDKHGLFTNDTRKLANIIKNIEQEDFDPKRILAIARSIKSLRDTEKELKQL
jgi:hypothetical protein